MNQNFLKYFNFLLGAVLGIIGACSPTKFNVNPPEYCINSNNNCITEDGITKVTDSYKVGAGKVDILFVFDNSASMSDTMSKISSKFAGFLDNLDRKDVDYQIGVTTTELKFAKSQGLVDFKNGSKILKKRDSSKEELFVNSKIRFETLACENFIKSSYYTFGSTFNTTDYYNSKYSEFCSSNDERGIYSAYEIINNNMSSLLRDDAHLNIILVSNEDVRSGLYKSNSNFVLDENDKASNFIKMMDIKYSSKFWQFNSIITKDSACAYEAQNSFKDKNGFPIKDNKGEFVIQTSIGSEYAALSGSPARDIEGKAGPRGLILNICENDYSSYFSNIAAKISDSSRLVSLKCKPMEEPSITNLNGEVINVPFKWNGDSQITFGSGSEGIDLKINYKCYSGVK